MALTDKQSVFVDEYLKTFNATQAAIAAGYSPKTAYNIGYENVRKREIAEVISQRLSESAMSADEVLARLADHARGDMGEFWTIEEGQPPVLNLAACKSKGRLNLIKKLKVKTTTRSWAEGDIPVSAVTSEIDFELYDAQSALEKIGRHHKLFTDKQELNSTVNNVAMTLAEWKEEQKKRQSQASSVLEDFSDE